MFECWVNCKTMTVRWTVNFHPKKSYFPKIRHYLLTDFLIPTSEKAVEQNDIKVGTIINLST